MLFRQIRRLSCGVVRLSLRTSCHRCFHMDTKIESTYEGAIYALNGLQSNSVYIQDARVQRNHNPEINITETEKHLNVLGIKVEDLNSLNVIHVSGTKGKGSTCAFTESILRSHGYKTGFYSSPHLISVNERIRLNGQPISQELFTDYFWQVFSTLQKNLEKTEKMPSYFRYLTIMAYYVFMKEKVDVAIMEVGIGGKYDCTNVIQKPVCVGVTTLDMDHVSLLGNTIGKIAEQKAGIFKPSVPAYSVPQQDSAMSVLKKTSEQIGCQLFLIPLFQDYEQSNRDPIDFGLLGVVQNINVSLALQLSQAWLKHHSLKEPLPKPTVKCDGDAFSHTIPIALPFHLDSVFYHGIKSYFWPGRFHIVKKENFSFYLDGAHTEKSMRHCARWFQQTADQESKENKVPSCCVLIFNCTGERRAETLLDVLSDIPFDFALFCPNRMADVKDASSDRSNFTVDTSTEMKICHQNLNLWHHMMSSIHENEPSSIPNTSVLSDLKGKQQSSPENACLFNSLGDALHWLMEDPCQTSDLKNIRKSLQESAHIQVLVTGSLHLVGGVLSVIDPCLNKTG